jgi:hypothetical protein
MAKDEYFCGCCGRKRAPGSEWCKRCKKHVHPKRTQAEATYLAQHGVDCPYQLKSTRL